MRLVEQTPDLGHLWVRYRLRPWPGHRGWWLDLSTRSLGGRPPTREISLRWLARALGDVVYLPPVEDGLADDRLALADSLVGSGTPVLMQYLPGDDAGLGGAAVAIYDLLDPLLDGDLEVLSRLPAGSAAVWPLIAGYTDDPESWHAGVERLAEAGVGCVQGVAPELSPTDRRRLVDAKGDSGFEALHHGPRPSERAFARVVSRLGLEPLLARPVPAGPPSLVGNRRIAEALATVGELWLQLDRNEARGQAFYRAARWIDRESHDVTALVREGNLAVVTWLDDASRAVVQDFVATGGSSLLAELRAEYLGPTG